MDRHPDQDAYPQLRSVLQALLEEPHLDDIEVERVEVTCLANGEATYRYWAPRAEESEGGFFEAGSFA